MKAKGKYLIVFWLAVLLISLSAGAAPGQEVFQFQAHSIKLEILPQGIFAARFGDNPDVPRTDAEIIALARKFFPPLGKKRPEAAARPVRWCREYQEGVLFAALQNPAVSDLTRRQVDYIIAAATPDLPKTYVSGHFRFFYTDNDSNPDHNVTLGQIKATAFWLNQHWDTYAENFRTPKNYLFGGTETVDVYVYYLGDNVHGGTDSRFRFIRLNSKLTVKTVAGAGRLRPTNSFTGCSTVTASNRAWPQRNGSPRARPPGPRSTHMRASGITWNS